MSPNPKLSEMVAAHLPLLRRYARALTGTQVSGDRYARATLEAILSDPSALSASTGSPRVALYRIFHTIWQSSGRPVAEDEPDPLRKRAQENMEGLDPDTREALLLHTVEGFSLNEVSEIIGAEAEEVEALVGTARRQMRDAIRGSVLIIEDEAIIGADLEQIVESMGHQVAGVARTASEAVESAKATEPDLVLADIQLADNSSGIDAVNEILEHASSIPVVFITAYPERLLTGERPEPAFLIAKPYRSTEVVTAVSQAMFFASTKTLTR